MHRIPYHWYWRRFGQRVGQRDCLYVVDGVDQSAEVCNLHYLEPGNLHGQKVDFDMFYENWHRRPSQSPGVLPLRFTGIRMKRQLRDGHDNDIRSFDAREDLVPPFLPYL